MVRRAAEPAFKARLGVALGLGMSALVLATPSPPAPGAGGDILLHGTRTVRTLSPDGTMASAPRELPIRTWIGSARSRYDQGDALSLVYRGDLDKLFFVYPTQESYSELTVPVHIEDYLNARQRALLDEISPLADPSVEIVAADGEERRNGWTVRRFEVTVDVPGFGHRMEITSWNTTELAVDLAAYSTLVRSYRELDLGRRRWTDEVAGLAGYPVLQREVLVLTDRRVESTYELQAVEEVDAGDEVYRVPEGFDRVPLTAAAEQLRVE